MSSPAAPDARNVNVMSPRALVSLSIWLAACGGGDGPSQPVDAPADGPPDGPLILDAAVPGDAPLDDAPAIDGGSAVTCTGAAYDPCTDNTQCDSGNCHLFSGAGFQVCVTACTPFDNSTCPVDKSGANATCNMKGICKPAEPNACTPP